MPNSNHIANTDRPLVRNPRHEDAAAPDEQRQAEARSLEEMRTSLARQADKIDAASRQIENSGMVTREEFNSLLAKHEAEVKSIMAVFEMFQQNDPRRGTPASADTLTQDRITYERTLEALHSAPKEAVYIVPQPYEAAAIEASQGQPLYRIICINNIQWPVPVGVMAEVPQQIADILKHAREGQLGLWRKQVFSGPPVLKHEAQPAQDLESIPRPVPQPFADEMGRSGVVGGDVFRPFNNEQPRALDAR